jgi:crotonobetainyl-CoA:carnitine CoA-transferase CaiB-like acyl-CoA transferase
MLADYGADVIKIERPESGDPARTLPPFFKDIPGVERSGLFLMLNTSKRSVTIDLEQPAGRDLVLRLARDAQVLVENFHPGTMERFGLGYEVLREVNPSLVVTSISNYGATGPYRDWEGTDRRAPRHDARGLCRCPRDCGRALCRRAPRHR